MAGNGSIHLNTRLSFVALYLIWIEVFTASTLLHMSL